MEELEKNIRVNKLYDIYGVLLTDTQKKMIELYYQDDLSLGEIAETEGISRNAVYDALRKGIRLLESYEDKLYLLKKKEENLNYFNELKNQSSKEQIELIELIERKVNR